AIIGLDKYPIFNSEIDMERKEIRIKHFFNVGVAVDTEQGLMVPVVRNCERKSITEIAIEINDSAASARERKLGLTEMSGSSFSVTNYGSVGVRFATPIINPPNTAILGVGRIAQRAVVVDGKIVIQRMLPLSFCFDHRVADGAAGAGFLAEVMRHLEHPSELLVDLI
ncbi:MAG: 2-oxo acid dehydrogenase subunit E2, partial [Candidatus Diapherotrites archaeon]|nr:2-oxo acid dehydrogenase subunit E2 [Candidatus Diapherotrites archaeon]